MTRHETVCPTCINSLRPGHLHLRGDDWVVCPDCGGSQTFVLYEQRIIPPRHFYMPHLKGTT